MGKLNNTFLNFLFFERLPTLIFNQRLKEKIKNFLLKCTVLNYKPNTWAAHPSYLLLVLVSLPQPWANLCHFLLDFLHVDSILAILSVLPGWLSVFKIPLPTAAAASETPMGVAPDSRGHHPLQTLFFVLCPWLFLLLTWPLPLCLPRTFPRPPPLATPVPRSFKD